MSVTEWIDLAPILWRRFYGAFVLAPSCFGTTGSAPTILAPLAVVLRPKIAYLMLITTTTMLMLK